MKERKTERWASDRDNVRGGRLFDGLPGGSLARHVLMKGMGMSFLIASPELLGAAASDLAGIGTTVSSANAAAAAQTTRVVAAAADEVSEAIASLFSGHALDFHALSAQAATFHDQFVQTLSAGAASYTGTEAANVQDTLSGLVNSPTEALFGRPLIGNGANGAPGTGANGQPGGILIGNGGAGQ